MESKKKRDWSTSKRSLSSMIRLQRLPASRLMPQNQPGSWICTILVLWYYLPTLVLLHQNCMNNFPLEGCARVCRSPERKEPHETNMYCTVRVLALEY